MYQSDQVVTIIRCGNRLQHEMANSYSPNRETIIALCQQIQNSTNALYRWANGIEEDENE